MTATGTPFPVEYCQALLTLSIANPGAVAVTLGSATVMVCAHMLLWRIGWSGPGVPSGGTSAGSTMGGEIAWAAGRLALTPTSSRTAIVEPSCRDRRARFIASAPM